MKNNEFKKVCIKNSTCYYFNGMIKLQDVDRDNILIDEKSHENILIYDISYKTLIDPKPFQINFDKIHIKIYDGTEYLALFGFENYDVISNRIRYLASLKSSIIYFVSLFCINQSLFL